MTAPKGLPDYRKSARNHNLRAEQFGVPGRLSAAEIKEVRHGKTCVYCGGTNRMGIDHVIPLSAGGANSVENIVPCCRSCNSRKWRNSYMGRWAWLHDQCVGCGTTAAPHKCLGLCTTCWSVEDAKRHRKKRAAALVAPHIYRGGELPAVCIRGHVWPADPVLRTKPNGKTQRICMPCTRINGQAFRDRQKARAAV
jgi:hypothetical protein